MLPLAPPFALRRATPEDRAFVETLTTRSYRDLVIRQFGSWNTAQQAANFAEKWQSNGIYWIVTRAEEPVACLLLEALANYLFIADIQIDGS